jgi:MOSC domain-containing protein YiiM
LSTPVGSPLAPELAAGDRVAIVERHEKSWSVRRFAALIALKTIDAETLSEIIAMPGLSEKWQLRALRLLSEMKGVG